MKYYFIINPVAGSSNKTEILTEEIKKAFSNRPNDEYIIYVTKNHNDGKQFVKEISSNLTEDVVFFACGGDGTTYEVLNGIVDYDKAILGVISVGSCNDFLKCFPNKDFRSIEKAISGNVQKIDLINCNGYHCLNEVNMGFDAMVNDDCNRIKAKTKKVKSAYTRAIIKNFLLKKSPYVLVTTDNEVLYEGKMLLMTFANGKYYGGGYCAAPLAEVNDGLLESLVVKNISRARFVTLIKDYKQGTHLSKPKFKRILRYKQAKEIKVEFKEDVCICLDGEISYAKEVNVKVESSKLRFLMPGE
ncbi:MAG: YegS/Rv2252/BmrU family lipid kinase [Bacilli bacterium]|nr:YegS/Rv2252/BmrU family lipid kinase [Bacilli bacterium]